jgi:hypothetical protein
MCVYIYGNCLLLLDTHTHGPLWPDEKMGRAVPLAWGAVSPGC